MVDQGIQECRERSIYVREEERKRRGEGDMYGIGTSILCGKTQV